MIAGLSVDMWREGYTVQVLLIKETQEGQWCGEVQMQASEPYPWLSCTCCAGAGSQVALHRGKIAIPHISKKSRHVDNL